GLRRTGRAADAAQCHPGGTGLAGRQLRRPGAARFWPVPAAGHPGPEGPADGVLLPVQPMLDELQRRPARHPPGLHERAVVPRRHRSLATSRRPPRLPRRPRRPAPIRTPRVRSPLPSRERGWGRGGPHPWPTPPPPPLWPLKQPGGPPAPPPPPLSRFPPPPRPPPPPPPVPAPPPGATHPP